ncbi:MAG TPA: hypothetical protein VGJ33_08490 [Candidatus Angelobacter sp.]|jgi:hypothetical protein
MATMTEDIRKTRSYAGLYLRTKRQMRFWGWGSASQKKFADAQPTETKRPWAGLAEWLRVAHSLLDGKTVEPQFRSDAANKFCQR